MSPPVIYKKIQVIGGVGSVNVDLFGNVCAVSVVPPVDTAQYHFRGVDGQGHPVFGTNDMQTGVYFSGWTMIPVDGPHVINFYDATIDGTYSLAIRCSQ